MAKGHSEKIWKRTLIITLLLLVVGFGAVIFNLFRWQIIRGEELKGAAMDQSLYSTKLTAQRGTIYDRTGQKKLAESSNVWTVVLEPAYIDDDIKKKLAMDLPVILDMEPSVVEKKLEQNNYFTYLKHRVEIDVKLELEKYLSDNKISQGVRLLDDYKRYYRYGSTASTVLGYIGGENNGLSGIEFQYENELKGTAGRLVSAKNAVGEDMPFQYEQIEDAEDGYDLYLTIDETVQGIVDKYLQQGIDQYVVENGAVGIVMDVKTGGILALSSKGDYDPNEPFTVYDEETRNAIDALPDEEQNEAYMTAINKQWRNKAVSDTYYPGSVFKICVGSMGLESGAITTDSTYTCNGSAMVQGVRIGCWRAGGHGTQTFTEGLCNSCNPYFIHIGSLLGPDEFFKYFEAFGFTEKTGIDLPGESISIYHSVENLNPVELATESMGQNFGITPIQMITAVSAVANGGYLVTPHVVDKVVDAAGNIVKSGNTGYKRQAISEETSKIMSEILNQNTTSGTANNGYIEGYRICGKTGTSEKVAEFNANPERGMQYIASYCGYAPMEDPQYALLVFFDEPQKEQNGGYNGGNAVAGPIFASIMKEILPYLGVKSQYSEEEFNNLDTYTPYVTDLTLDEAYQTIDEIGLNYTVIGDYEDGDTKVSLQIPAAGESIPKDGTVYLYTYGYDEELEVEVPDFSNCSFGDCNYYASIAGVQVRAEGGAAVSSGYARSQNIAAGTKVKPGTVITVSFVDNVITETFLE